MELSAVALAAPACVGVLWLAWWHAKLVLGNKTTIEHVEGVAVRPAAVGAGAGGGAALAGSDAASSLLAPAAQAARAAAAAAMAGGGAGGAGARAGMLPRALSSPLLAGFGGGDAGRGGGGRGGSDDGGGKGGKKQHLHPWDLGGPWRNAASVLGPNPWLWLVPPLRPAPGGLSFRSRWD
jgi:hypothetical protein